jgi:alkaline phosphatase D
VEPSRSAGAADRRRVLRPRDAAGEYNPAAAGYTDFDVFWEFVAGPLNAGTFGPNAMDATFGPQVVFVKAPPSGQANLSPYAGYQFFGEVNVDAQGQSLTVDLRDIDGQAVYTKTLVAEHG